MKFLVWYVGLFFDDVKYEDEINFCPFFWKIIFSLFMTVLGSGLAAVFIWIASFPVVAIASVVMLFFYDISTLSDAALGYIMFSQGFSIVLASIYIIVNITESNFEGIGFGVDELLQKHIPERKIKPRKKEPSPPSFFELAYRKFKDKTCIQIDLTKYRK